MIDRQAVVWTRIAGQPVKMGILYITDRDARFTYDRDYIDTGYYGLGLVYPPGAYGIDAIVRERNHFFDFHPPIQSLIPPRSERNFQRSLILKYLDKVGIHPTPGFETDWKILIHSGHGAIGHLDVFANDNEAAKWYSSSSRQDLVSIEDGFGFSLKEFLTWYDNDASAIIDILGPTPSVGGAIPKLPLSIPREGWDGRIGLPTRYGDTNRTDIILKLEKATSYPGIVELEQLAFELHKKAGFEVPRYWAIEVNGLHGLVIERFDRDENCTPLFMETFYSLLASGKKSISHHYSDTYDSIGKALDNPNLMVTSDPGEAKYHLLKRLVMAILTGNGDLHLENLALLGKGGEVKFSPVYDPTPMRAYKLHDMLMPPGMTFGDYGDIIDRSDTPLGFAPAFERFCKTLKISRKKWSKLVENCLQATHDYPQLISQLKILPDENKDNLSKIHQQSVTRFEKLLT